MEQQASDAELEIMKIIWANGESARFAAIMDELASKGKTWQKKYGHHASVPAYG